MDTHAVIFEGPERLRLDRIGLAAPEAGDVMVDVEWSGISTGTERLLYSGRMPPFPGLGYPLVPGYEAVGRICAGDQARLGERVFVPGARCFGPVRGLFGASAARLTVPGTRAVAIPEGLEERGVLLALAATAHHALAIAGDTPDLVVGHGVLGRLVARLSVARGGSPTVWEADPGRRAGAIGYPVTCAEDDSRTDYAAIVDVSGEARILDGLVARLAPRGQIVLAGFYAEPLSFAFPPAFMREATLRIAAEWRPDDLAAIVTLVADGALSLDGLVTDVEPALQAPRAYRVAFGDPACLKMVLDWRGLQ